MKKRHSNHERAVALITTLILVSAITLVTISVLTISQNEAQISGSRLSNTRADLAERAAFEEAKNLLLALTGNDDYIVSSVMEETGAPSDVGMRYTFISTPKQGSVSHVPLFAGGETKPSSLVNLDETATSIIVDTAIGRPVAKITANEKSKEIEAFGLTHLSEDGRMVPEDRFPETGFIEMAPDPTDKFRLRYTWWAEDLEGYPNIDVVGGWTDHAGDEYGVAFDFIRPGYSANDARALPGEPGNDGGMRILDPNDPYFAWRFPKSFRGQQFTGQVAPGLSPREIILQPWATAEIPLRAHPFTRGSGLSTARHWLSSGGAYTHSATMKREHRFMLGFHDYLSVPHIPYNHGYADAGKPRFNLNALVANRVVSRSGAHGGIVEIIEANLEDFGTLRRGGFPATESYLATIAANAIDYADADSVATVPDNSENAGNHSYRGVDSYCPINEFFVKLQYDGPAAGPAHKISMDCYAEFWNTSNHVAEMSGMKIDLTFLNDLEFQYSIFQEPARITEANITLNEPLNIPTDSGPIGPNQFLIHHFGKLEWTIPAAGPESDIEGLWIQNIKRFNTGSSVKVSYSHSIQDTEGNDIVVDSCSRLNPQGLPGNGFVFLKYTDPLVKDEYFLRLFHGNNGTVRRLGGLSSINGSFLGDPWMTYYAESEFGEVRGTNKYVNHGSPGFRNFSFQEVIDNERHDLIKAQTRVRAWPDRGYDSIVAPNSAPNSDQELPPTFNGQTDENKAPWRISNHGRFFSVTELGNLHDPAMWSSLTPLNNVGAGYLNQNFNIPAFHNDYPSSFANTRGDIRHTVWGGGNTLRIGRPEHPLFDAPGMRASQLLDLFQVGYTGTNLAAMPGSGIDLYETYDPRDHQPPPAAPDAIAANSPPFNRIYDERLHAQGIFQKRHGHLNINSAPTVFEIETLLRGPFGSTDFTKGDPTPTDHITPNYVSAGGTESLSNSLRSETIPLIARGLYEARPFYSPSHLARVLSELVQRHDAMPEVYNDAAAEETFARTFNTTSFSSRHFRIFTYGDVLPKNNETILSRSRKIYEVFMEPEHNDNGEVTRVTTRILSIRDL